MNPIACSVGILTRNSAKTLGRALDSVKGFSDLIICDGGSTDQTLEIAQAANARILQQAPSALDGRGYITDFSVVRNQTLAAAKEGWFFFLDSDEYASAELIEAIRIAVSENPAAYWVYRKYELNGVRIECASTYPNKNMRFFHRSIVTNFEKPVHERIALREFARPLSLPEGAPLIVPVYDSPAESREKNRRYLRAESLHQQNISFLTWLRRVLRRFLVSSLYAARTFKAIFLCQGPRLPLAYEINRHWYHAALSWQELYAVKRYYQSALPRFPM
jgi:glycosyltransferase involved in cell wall biosynthesis